MNPIYNPEEFHFMVDIETLAVSNNAAITEIGIVPCIVEFNAGDFHEHCMDTLGERDPNTIEWRKSNNLPWREDARHINDVLQDAFTWIKFQADGAKPILWCKGTDFDAVIIRNAWKRYGNSEKDLPWAYNSIRDIRTLLALFPQFKIPKEQTTHNALQDAKDQRQCLNQILTHMNQFWEEHPPQVNHG